MSVTPSIMPISNFHPNQDAAILRKILKAFIFHSRKLFIIICNRCSWQRQEIARTYDLMYGKNLVKKLKSKLSAAGYEEKQRLVLALMQPLAVYQAKQLRKAVQGTSRKSVLIEVMISQNNGQLVEVLRKYEELYSTDLEIDLSRRTSGFLQEGISFSQRPLSSCVTNCVICCRRDETNDTDEKKAAEDALLLYSSAKSLCEHEKCFIDILTSRNYKQLKIIFDEYEKVAHHSIEAAILQDFSGSFCKGLLALVSIVRNRSAYFAKLLHKFIKNHSDGDLVRLLVSRSECDMIDIGREFEILYEKPLKEVIRKNFSGSYKRALIALANGNRT
ncbi:unnamed protein product [Cylicocyclus nassatus]|uniref:Annexin n=1 Tax=Cylicocyclus nassatus TaxID=53992 RepID=A0AA36GUM3_CYLNA|nr:unnamed protein product [Cylicocyclus nassatus]